jgi:amino acid adenylation domain-containing protein
MLAYCKLTDAQAAIWVAQKIIPESPVFNISEYAEIFGEIDVDILSSASRVAYLNADALHLRFIDTVDGPMQYFAPDDDTNLVFMDLSAHENPAHTAAVWMETDSRTPASPTDDAPPLIFALLKLAPAHFIFYHRTHHLLFDGMSGILFFQEVERNYLALASTGMLPDPSPGSWRDIVDEEQRYKQSPRFVRDREYWLAKLDGKAMSPSLSGKSTSGIGPACSLRATQWIVQETIQRLRDLGAQCGASLTHVFTAAAGLYFHHFTGDDDVIVGLAIAGRIRKETRGIPGVMSNTLPIRMIADGDMPVQTFVAETARLIREAMRHQLYRSENTYRDLHLQAGRGNLHSLCVNVFSLDYAAQFAGFPSATHNVVVGPVEDCQLSLYEGQSDHDVRLDFDGNGDLYDTATLSSHLERFVTFLTHLAQADPQTAIAELPLLTAVERHRLIYQWNATNRDYPVDDCVHRLFERQARRTPDALAISSEEGAMTYAELDARANQLAHHLLAQGTGPGKIIALCLERSVELVIAALGVLKAGAAYLPLDPAYPAERLAFILADAGADVLLTAQSFLGRVQEFDGTICLDAQASAIAAWPSSTPDMAPIVMGAPDASAYVIYTSGSTGNPKGVAIAHRNLLNLIHWHGEAYALTPADRATVIAGPAFDASVWEIWPYLAVGASLHIPPPRIRQDPELLIAWLAREDITLSFMPTPLAEAVIARPWPDECALRVLLTGGDQLTRRPLPDAPFRLVNHYGPTENTVVSTCMDVLPQGEGDRAPAIGKPIANTRIYLVNPRGRPVPVGTVGEIVVAGAQVARGYLSRPDMTRERFGPDPFAALPEQPDARIFRTGDLGRYRPDGAIEFLGRNDDQVKIRGIRVEPGEVEAALGRHPNLRDVAVVACADTSGDKRLVAYFVPTSPMTGNELALIDEPALINDLRRHARTCVPEHMVPSAFVVVEALPLTANGKIDRRALIAKGPVPAVQPTTFAQATPIAQVLAGIWSELLGVGQVRDEDNFFELGGHSLMALKVIAELRERSGLDVPVRLIFEAPTFQALCDKIDEQALLQDIPAISVLTEDSGKPVATEAAAAESLDADFIEKLLERQRAYVQHWKGPRHMPNGFIVSRNPDGAQPGVFWCLQGAEELDQLAVQLGPNRPVHGMRSGHLVMDYTLATVTELATYYVSEMVNIQPEGDFLIGGNCQGALIAQLAAVVLQRMGRSVTLLFLMELPFLEPYHGKVALIYGKDSTINPYVPGADPDANFQLAYPEGYTVDIITGAHGQFFQTPNIDSLGATLRLRLEQTARAGDLTPC